MSVKTQRLEELAIKQSRQLIPVTPSMPKALVRELRCKTFFYRLSLLQFANFILVQVNLISYNLYHCVPYLLIVSPLSESSYVCVNFISITSLPCYTDVRFVL